MPQSLDRLAERAGVEQWFDYQLETFTAAQQQEGPQQRLCLYYRTGAGKSLTALVCVALWGCSEAVVIAPPSTHAAWKSQAETLGMEVTAISHAKFRQAGFKLKRGVPVIADEFHLFGGHKGAGWRKLDRLAQGLQAPMVLASATPNYNDAERVYCIQHILDAASVSGGFLEFVYRHCKTEQNPFGQMPNVTGFLHHKDAAAYLASLDNVHYLPDNVTYTIEDVPFSTPVDPLFEIYGADTRSGRLIASQMEERHKRIFNSLVDTGEPAALHPHVFKEVDRLIDQAQGPVLVFAAHATVANAAAWSLGDRCCLVDGSTPPARKELILDAFRSSQLEVLVGTATLATGTDGLDKVCDTLIILDDTDDDALRRQLVGRIMPRGEDVDASMKKVFRLVHS